MNFGMIQLKLSSLRLALGLFAAGMSAFSPVYAQQNVISTGSASGSPPGSVAGASNPGLSAAGQGAADALMGRGAPTPDFSALHRSNAANAEAAARAAAEAERLRAQALASSQASAQAATLGTPSLEELQARGAQARAQLEARIDLRSIPDPSLSSLPFSFQSPEGPFRSSLERLALDLSKIQPQFGKQRDARAWGLLSVEEADLSLAQNELSDAAFYHELAVGFLDLAVGLDPVTGTARAVAELYSGRNFVTGARLTEVELGFAALNVATVGAGGLVRSAFRGVTKIASRSAAIVRNWTVAQRELAKAERVLESAVGRALRTIRHNGLINVEEGYKVFDGSGKFTNPIPENGVFARIVPRDMASKIVSGEVPLSRPNIHREAFITAYEDLCTVNDPREFAKRLSLFQDHAGTLPVDTSNYVVLRFRFKGDTALLASPVEFGGQRGFGFLSGGKTAGGAREWIIDHDLNQRNLIEFID